MGGTKKKVVVNLLMNSGSTFLYALILQVLIFPIINQHVGQDEFGRLLTTMAVVNVVGMVLGGAISNLVLKEYSEHDQSLNKIGGFTQFNSCFIISVILLTPVLVFAFYAVQAENVVSIGNIEDLVNIIVPVLITIALALRVYLVVEFRLALNYTQVAKVRFFVVAGYAIGLFSFLNNYFSFPILIIFVGEAVCVFYLLLYSSIIREGVSFSKEVAVKMRRYFGLSLSVISNNLMAYGDRLILAQVIGFSSVSVFFSAAIGGRIVQMCLDPVANVLLSYLVSYKTTVTVKRFVTIILVCILFSVVVWGVMQMVVPYIIMYLYADYFNDALQVLSVVNAGFSVKASEVLLRPLITRIVPVRSIALVDSILAVVYLLSGGWAALKYGINGFATNFVIVGILRMILMIGLIYKNSKLLEYKIDMILLRISNFSFMICF